jgi:hypothetical protein
VKQTHRILLAGPMAFGMVLSGCNAATAPADAGVDPKAYEATITSLKEPIGLIAAYSPYLAPPDPNEAFAPKKRPDAERAAACAANEIRHAANGARQKLKSDAPTTKILEPAMSAVTTSCTDASEATGVEKCRAAVKALDEALAKSGTESAAAGVTAKFPRVAPESVTPEAKAAMAQFLRARGPGAAEQAFMTKRADPKVTVADLTSACEAASGEAGDVAAVLEKAEEPLRLVAVTHKMSLDSQCRALTTTEGLRKEVEGCKKNAKTTECAIVCGKAKVRLEDGIVAAAFSPFEKEVADTCKE